MNIIEAFKTGLSVRRTNKSFGYFSQSMYTYTQIPSGIWIDSQYFLDMIHLNREDITADDWEVKNNFELESIK